MKTLIFLIASAPAMASDAWICKTESSVPVGPSRILTCGVAEGATEGEARDLAFKAAFREFQQVCDSSDECRGRKVSSRPQRTQCESTDAGFKCYRALEFSLAEGHKNVDEEIERRKIELASVEEEKAKKEGLVDLERKARLSTPGSSFWSLGFELLVNGATFEGLSTTQVGFGLSAKRCFFGFACPQVLLTAGKFSESSTYVGSFGSAAAGLSIFLSSRWYLSGLVGAEYDHGDHVDQHETFELGTLGVEAVRVDGVSLNLEGGVKAGSGISASPVFAASFNFKF